MKSYEISVEIRAEHVKTIRKLRKQSQAALAKSAGISPAYLCLIEKGKQKTATNTVAMKIATALAVEPEEICSGYVEPKEDTENLLTAAEREQYAVAYLGHLRDAVWYRRQYYNFDFEEAYSEGLVAFARALFTFNKASGSSFPHYVEHALEGTFKSECRKRNAAKRSADVFSLDKLIDGSEQNSRDFYNLHPSSFNLEERVCLRDECREAVKTLTPERRRDPYIADLLEVVGL